MEMLQGMAPGWEGFVPDKEADETTAVNLPRPHPKTHPSESLPRSIPSAGKVLREVLDATENAEACLSFS